MALVSLSIALSASGSAALAASGQPVPTVAIDLQVGLVAPTVLDVGLTYTCLPSPTPVGYVSVMVTQAGAVPSEASGASVLMCDGALHRTDVLVFGGPLFTPGDALASAQACTELTCGSDARKVVIVPAPPAGPPVIVNPPGLPGTPGVPAGPKPPALPVAPKTP